MIVKTLATISRRGREPIEIVRWSNGEIEISMNEDGAVSPAQARKLAAALSELFPAKTTGHVP